MTITAAEWSSALEVVRAADSVVLMCHVGPDGDALGSMLGLGLALHRRGVEVRAAYDDDSFVGPRHLQFLPRQDWLVPPSAVPARPAVVRTSDTGSIYRLGASPVRAKAADALL